MGQEILYCFKCQIRVTTADLDSANALRFGNRTACKNCVPDLLASLTAQERKDLVSRVQSPKKAATARFQAPPTPRGQAYPVAGPGRSNQIVLWIIGAVVVVLLIGIIFLMGGSGSAPPPREAPPPSRAAEESPRDRSAREAIAKAKGMPASDPDAQLAAFEQAARTAEGTSREREAKELRDEFIAVRRKALVKELSGLDERARLHVQKEEFGAALAIFDAVRPLHPGAEWKGLVEAKVDEVRKAVDAAFAPLADQAAAARAKGAENEVKSIRERVARWGLANKVADLDSRLRNGASSQPPPPPTPVAVARPWVPIFDGKSLDFLLDRGEGAWVIESGTLAHVKERKNSAQTKRHFTDGELRIRFKVRQSSHVGFALRQSENGFYGVSLDRLQLDALDDKEHEFLIFFKGDVVTATLDGKPHPIEPNGKPLKGPLQFNSYGEYFVIKTLEFREAAELQTLVGHWTFDTASDDNTNDFSGSKNDAKLLDGAVLGPGRLGNAVRFDGAKSRVAVPSSQSLTIQGPMTIVAWVNPSAGKEATAPGIVEKWDQVREGGTSGYLLRISKAGQAHFLVGSPAGSGEVFSTTPIPNDAWTCLAAVYDKGSLKIYVNGVLEKSVPTSAVPGTSRTALRIGTGGGGGGHQFLGSIDDVRIYCQAISAEEIARLAAR